MLKVVHPAYRDMCFLTIHVFHNAQYQHSRLGVQVRNAKSVLNSAWPAAQTALLAPYATLAFTSTIKNV